jgi:hypothetical protein
MCTVNGTNACAELCQHLAEASVMPLPQSNGSSLSLLLDDVAARPIALLVMLNSSLIFILVSLTRAYIKHLHIFNLIQIYLFL